MSMMTSIERLQFMYDVIDSYLKSESDIHMLLDKLYFISRRLDGINVNFKKNVNDFLILIQECLSEKNNERTSNLLKDLQNFLHKALRDPMLFFCKVCGLCITKNASDFCDCCGLKFDEQNCSIQSIREKREKWLLHPDFWFNPKAMPENWKIEDQLEHISEMYF